MPGLSLSPSHGRARSRSESGPGGGVARPHRHVLIRVGVTCLSESVSRAYQSHGHDSRYQ
eukprot:3054935-Rhodomonas_salina.4